MWYEYYSKHFDLSDIYIVDNGSDPGTYDGIKCNVDSIREPDAPGERRELFDHRITMPKVNKCLSLLGKYQYILNVDTDEFVVPDPERWPGGLRQFIEEFDGVYAQCAGYNILDDGQSGAFDPDKKPWLMQRKYYHLDTFHYCKVVLASEDPKWEGGSHDSKWNRHHDPATGASIGAGRDDFRLFHLHYVCAQMLRRRYARRRLDVYQEADCNRLVAAHFDREGLVRQEIPEKWRLSL